MVLARLPQEDAQRLIEYLGKHQVDAIMEPGKMSGSFFVIGMQGFAAGELGSAKKRQYESRLKALGLKWKKEEKGSTDFTHAYWAKYDGG